MEKKPYLIAGVKPSMRVKYINEAKDNQSDLKELHEYAHTKTNKGRHLLSFIQRCKNITRPTSEVS